MASAIVQQPTTVHQQTQSKIKRPDPLDLRGTDELATDLLPYFRNYVEKRRQRNMDIYIACTGREGWGKSSLGLTALLHLYPDYSPNDVILDVDDYYRVYDPHEKDAVYVFDEANRLFFNRNWNERGQKSRIQEVMENRKNRNLIFLHTPQMKTLDKYAREGRIDLWFACMGQGKAMVRRLKYNSYLEEAYYPVRIQDHRWLPLELTHPEFAEAYYERKDDAHTSNFHQRKRENMAKRQEAKKETDYKLARKDRAMSEDKH